VKLTLIGRPALDAIQTRPTYVAFRMQGKAPGPLPKGLPPVPDQHPIPWLVVIALRQWNRVKDSLAGARSQGNNPWQTQVMALFGAPLAPLAFSSGAGLLSPV